MKFTYSIPFDRSADATWEALRDTERLIRCIPGCEDVQPALGPCLRREPERAREPERGGLPAARGQADAPAGEAGVELFTVRMATGLGPIRLRASGTAKVRRDSDTRSMTADVSLSDARSGSIYGTMALAVRPADTDRSEILLNADVVLASKIGEFAQPILRHKADQTVKEFVRNLIDAFPRAAS